MVVLCGSCGTGIEIANDTIWSTASTHDSNIRKHIATSSDGVVLHECEGEDHGVAYHIPEPDAED